MQGSGAVTIAMPSGYQLLSGKALSFVLHPGQGCMLGVPGAVSQPMPHPAQAPALPLVPLGASPQ